MMDRLTAEEDLGAAAAAGVGAGTKPGPWIRDTIRRWERASRGRRERAAAGAPKDLMAAGIGVKIVEKKKE